MQPYTYRQKIQEAKIEVAKTSLREIGLTLREAREKKSLTVRDIRELTCIPINHILAIENGAREQLPEDLYLIGFIKRYAKAVGLNGKLICSKYSNEGKVKNYNEESDAFDLLFNEEKEKNVFDFKTRRKHVNKEVIEKSFLKVYHFYFFIGVLLFFVACYLMFQYYNETKSNLNIKKEKFFKEENKIELPISIEFEGNSLESEEKNQEVVNLEQNSEVQKKDINEKLVKKVQEAQVRKQDKLVKVQKTAVPPKPVPNKSKLVTFDSKQATFKNNQRRDSQQVLVHKSLSVKDTKNIVEVTRLRPLPAISNPIKEIESSQEPILRGLKTIH